MVLKGNNISIRDWQLQDLEKYRFYNTGKHLWMEFDGPYYPKANETELEKTINFIKQKLESNSWAAPRRGLVISKVSDNQLIGTVNWYWQSKETNWKSIGIVIYENNIWGKSLGFEALKLWINYLFVQDKTLVRLDLRTWSGNKRMIKLGTKLGFKTEAIFRNARIVNGKYYDSIGVGILREEWCEIY